MARTERKSKQHKRSDVVEGVLQPATREGQAGLRWKSERLIVVKKPGKPVERRGLCCKGASEGVTAGD